MFVSKNNPNYVGIVNILMRYSIGELWDRAVFLTYRRDPRGRDCHAEIIGVGAGIH